mmetsp:Transcript_2227/g.5241  ORF Transcript_2227/g.5241 Transcript_2227/m.5241 type:complete len:269 (+) Transcript_2227:230-1036(+)
MHTQDTRARAGRESTRAPRPTNKAPRLGRASPRHRQRTDSTLHQKSFPPLSAAHGVDAASSEELPHAKALPRVCLFHPVRAQRRVGGLWGGQLPINELIVAILLLAILLLFFVLLPVLVVSALGTLLFILLLPSRPITPLPIILVLIPVPVPIPLASLSPLLLFPSLLPLLPPLPVLVPVLLLTSFQQVPFATQGISRRRFGKEQGGGPDAVPRVALGQAVRSERWVCLCRVIRVILGLLVRLCASPFLLLLLFLPRELRVGLRQRTV